jgi:hypothetical protein
MIFFTAVCTMGYYDQGNAKIMVDGWIMDDHRIWTILFFLFFFYWTSANLKNIQRSTLSGIIGQWYFIQ